MVSDAEKNKSLVRYFLDEVYNKGNYAIADSVVAVNYTSHNKLDIEVLGPEGIKKAARMQRTAFPDLRSEVVDIICEGEKVVVRGRDRGTFQGEFMNIPPTGNTFDITWIDIFRIENGKLAEAWLEMDSQDFRNQLTKGK